MEAGDGLGLGSPGNGDGCLCGICHTGPARGTNICTRRKVSCQYCGDYESDQLNVCEGLCWTGFDPSLGLPSQHRIFEEDPPLTFKSGHHPLGWSAGQGVLQCIHTHFILGCHLEQKKLHHVMTRT